MTVTASEQRTSAVRDLLDLLDSYPEIPLPMMLSGREYSPLGIPFGFHPDATDDEVKAQLVVAARTLLVGEWTKKYDDSCLRIYGRTASGLYLHLYAPRDRVCTRVVTGTETVEVVDPEALAALPKVTQEREVVEWRCEPLLAAEVAS